MYVRLTIFKLLSQLHIRVLWKNCIRMRAVDNKKLEKFFDVPCLHSYTMEVRWGWPVWNLGLRKTLRT